MNPANPIAPNAGEIHLLALEQAYANSLAKQDNTQEQLDRLFQQLEKLILANKIPPTSPKIHLSDIIPIQAAPTRWWPPPPALPNEYDGDHSKGQAFLTSRQMYICLCLNSFPEEQVKITWVLSYMKSRWAAKWAERIFQWEERNGGYSKFPNWEEFRKEFQRDFCPAHSDVMAINKLESTGYMGVLPMPLWKLGMKPWKMSTKTVQLMKHLNWLTKHQGLSQSALHQFQSECLHKV